LQERNFARAGGLIRSLQNHFDEAIIQKRLASKKYISKTPIKSKTASEILELFRGIDWENAKDELQSHSDWSHFDRALASEMRNFDPQRFDKGIIITDDQWQGFVKELESERDNPPFFLNVACSLKELDPERFERDVKINDVYWKNIAKEVKKEKNVLSHFVFLYEMAYIIDAQKIQELVSIDKSYWDKMKQEIERLSYFPKYIGIIAGAAQRIKPEGLPDITISREQWGKMKYELENMLKSGATERMTFMSANKLKNLKVE